MNFVSELEVGPVTIFPDAQGRSVYDCVYKWKNRSLWRWEIGNLGESVIRELQEAIDIQRRFKSEQVLSIDMTEKGENFFHVVSEETFSSIRYVVKQNMTARSVVQSGLQVARGLNLLHKNDILYGMVAPDFLFCSPSSSSGFSVKLGDFSSAVSCDGNPVPPRGYDSFFASPECLSLHQIQKESETFSFGSLLFFLITGTHPFSTENELRKAQIPEVNQWRLNKKLLHVFNELNAICSKCWKIDPVARPSWEDIIGSLEELEASIEGEKGETSFGFVQIDRNQEIER